MSMHKSLHKTQQKKGLQGLFPKHYKEYSVLHLVTFCILKLLFSSVHMSTLPEEYLNYIYTQTYIHFCWTIHCESDSTGGSGYNQSPHIFTIIKLKQFGLNCWKDSKYRIDYHTHYWYFKHTYIHLFFYSGFSTNSNDMQ